MRTYSSKLHTLVSAFLSKMFDVGDLPVLTLGNCVMCTNDRGDQVVFETTHVRFYVFFKIQKTGLQLF